MRKAYLLSFISLLFLVSGYFYLEQIKDPNLDSNPSQSKLETSETSGAIIENRSNDDSEISEQGIDSLEVADSVFEESLKNIQSDISENKDEKGEVVDITNEKIIERETIRKEKEVIYKDFGNNDGFTLSKEELQELRKASSDNNGYYPGVSSRLLSNALTSTADPEEVTQEPAETAPAADTGPRLVPVSGQARGYNMIYLMHPAARDTVEAQVEALSVSALDSLYLGALTDGTFGKNYSYLEDVVRRLNAKSKGLTLVLYLSNGPTMRNNTFDSRAGFNWIEPERFRDLIRFDSATREVFRQMVLEAKPVLELNRNANPASKNIVIVMLEDNLDKESYIAMREIAKAELGSLVQFMRNPCEGCYDGNDSDSDGDLIEEHSFGRVANLLPGYGYSNDGHSFYFPWETKVGDNVSLDELKNYQQVSLQRGAAYFGLWRSERQGIYYDRKISPDERTYEKPTLEQLVQEVRLLRDGLNRAAQ